MFSGKITTRWRIGVAVRGPSAVWPMAAMRKLKTHKTITGNNRAIFRMFVYCMQSLRNRADDFRVSGNWNRRNLILSAALASLKDPVQIEFRVKVSNFRIAGQQTRNLPATTADRAFHVKVPPF